MSVRVVDDREALALAGAEMIVAACTSAVSRAGRFDLVLAGGGTPRGVYETLAAAPFRTAMDWSRVRVFWGDERCVPATHAASNYRLAYETLLSRVPIADESVFRIQGEVQPALAAARYEQLVRSEIDGEPPRFDMVLLGLGTDGHIASLFPDSAHGPGIAIATRAPVAPRDRVSLTLPVINAAREVLFLVAGQEKAAVLRSVLEEAEDDAFSGLPAAGVRPTHGRGHWLVDRAAAGQIGSPGEPAPLT